MDRPVVVVTGGSGLLGSRLIRRLLPEYRIVSLDLDGDPESPAEIDFVCTDLTSQSSVDRAFRRIEDRLGREIASIVHLAAFYDFSGEPSPMYRKVTVDGTARLLDAARRLDVDQFVFSSTMLVHRPTEPGDPISEDDPVVRSWAYPTSKIETEDVVEREAPGGMKTVIVRLAGVYDEDGHSPPLTNQIMRIHGRWVTSHFYPAALDRGQSFVHLDDAVDALARIVDRRAQLPGHVDLLVGEPETVGYGELQRIIGEGLHGTEWQTWRIPEPLARIGAAVREKNPFGTDPFIRSWMVGHAADHYELDIGRARELLGWEPEHRIRDVLPDMIRRLERDPNAWYAENGLQRPRRAA